MSRFCDHDALFQCSFVFAIHRLVNAALNKSKSSPPHTLDLAQSGCFVGNRPRLRRNLRMTEYGLRTRLSNNNNNNTDNNIINIVKMMMMMMDRAVNIVNTGKSSMVLVEDNIFITFTTTVCPSLRCTPVCNFCSKKTTFVFYRFNEVTSFFLFLSLLVRWRVRWIHRSAAKYCPSQIVVVDSCDNYKKYHMCRPG